MHAFLSFCPNVSADPWLTSALQPFFPDALRRPPYVQQESPGHDRFPWRLARRASPSFISMRLFFGFYAVGFSVSVARVSVFSFHYAQAFTKLHHRTRYARSVPQDVARLLYWAVQVRVVYRLVYCPTYCTSYRMAYCKTYGTKLRFLCVHQAQRYKRLVG